jgi:putative hydrolase of the HAD superfamily
MPGVNEVVEWASEHFEVGLISNNMPGFIDRLIRDKIIPDINYKVIVDSSKAGVIKPDAKIYQIAQELAAVDSKEILTIDDSRSNLVVADRAGWHVVWFDEMDPAESVERIRQALEF